MEKSKREPAVLVVAAGHAPDTHEVSELMGKLDWAYSSVVVLQRLNRSAARSPERAKHMLSEIIQPSTQDLPLRRPPTTPPADRDHPAPPRKVTYRQALADEYFELVTGDQPRQDAYRIQWGMARMRDAVPERSRLRLAVAQFASPGFIGFFANRAAADVVETTLSHRRESQVLKAGGTAAEVARRQAEADKVAAEAERAAAEARIMHAEAAEAESRAGARATVDQARSDLQATLLRQVTSAVQAGLPPEQLAQLLADAHQHLTLLDRLFETGRVTSVDVRTVQELRDGPELLSPPPS